MKKLLVLSLVLAVAGLANAAYSIALIGNEIVVSNDQPLVGGIDFGIGIIGPEGLFGPISFRTVDAPVADKVIFDYSHADLGGAEGGLPWTGGLKTITWGDATLTPNAAGEWLRMTLVGAPVGTVVGLTDNTGVALADEGFVQSVTIVPEPMTMGLLGLGALFLRKRK